LYILFPWLRMVLASFLCIASPCSSSRSQLQCHLFNEDLPSPRWNWLSLLL
jgi:hypothetical protein